MNSELEVENLFRITKELRDAILELNQYGGLSPKTIKGLKELI